MRNLKIGAVKTSDFTPSSFPQPIKSEHPSQSHQPKAYQLSTNPPHALSVCPPVVDYLSASRRSGLGWARRPGSELPGNEGERRCGRVWAATTMFYLVS